MAFEYTLQIELNDQIKSLLKAVNGIDINHQKYAAKKISIVKKQIDNLSYMVEKISINGLGTALNPF